MATRERSALYPSITWNDCIEFVRAVDSFKLKSVSYSEVAKKYGIANTTTKSFAARISASKQFGLITTSGGNTIQLTDTCKRILYPTGAETTSIELVCFSMPPLYNKLIAVYDGKALPSETIFGNILMTDHKITRSVKDIAAQCFMQSAEQLGLIQGGILVYSDMQQNKSATVPPIDETENADNTTSTSLQSESITESTNIATLASALVTESDFIIQSYPMQSGKVAKLIIPNDSDEDTLLLLKDTFDAILRRKFKISI